MGACASPYTIQREDCPGGGHEVCRANCAGMQARSIRIIRADRVVPHALLRVTRAGHFVVSVLEVEPGEDFRGPWFTLYTHDVDADMVRARARFGLL